ncbi:Protein-tyrosine sulfotransferase 1 [Holothuria leucospilota]|uniref:Protein-tyrosine sulfotransferase n=1 Tax=Holothuria leucospilota TaxID=206669 RepID=A0A9Q1CE58_HOLLE|nr:Protein-tyrosine sulfotransferase 1 [Holothuria leucospilota]
MLRQRSVFILKVLLAITVVYLSFQCTLNSKTTNTTLKDAMWPGLRVVTTFEKDRRTSRMVFIGGPPYSGATLMRDLLNLHPRMTCRMPPKGMVLSRLAGLRTQWDITQAKSNGLREIGLTAREIDTVVKKFILKALGVPAKSNKTVEACVEDDSALNSMEYLRELFPGSKFILLVRDGRTLVQSIISGKVKVSGYDASNYEKCFKQWDENVKNLYNNCLDAGSSTCTVIYYEKLRRNPLKWLKYVLSFLQVDWKPSILHHLDRVESEDVLQK